MLVTIGIIIGTIIGTISGAWALIDRLWPFVSRRLATPSIVKLHAPMRSYDDQFLLWRGMALGVEALNVSGDLGQNTIRFTQSNGPMNLDVPLSGGAITGGATAPGPAVLTTAVPGALRSGGAMVTLEVNARRSSPVAVSILNAPLAPTLLGFGTTFAAMRTPSGAAGKRLVIGGFGFSADAQGNIVSFVVGDCEETSRPTAVRGDALLGVVIPVGLPTGPVDVSVYTLFGDKKSPSSNHLRLMVVSPPRITGIDPYVRVGGELRITTEEMPYRDERGTWVVLEPYDARRPVVLQAKRVPIETEIVVGLPRRNVKPGPYDVRIIVHGDYSSNSAVVDVQGQWTLAGRLSRLIRRV